MKLNKRNQKARDLQYTNAILRESKKAVHKYKKYFKSCLVVRDRSVTICEVRGYNPRTWKMMEINCSSVVIAKTDLGSVMNFHNQPMWYKKLYLKYHQEAGVPLHLTILDNLTSESWI